MFNVEQKWFPLEEEKELEVESKSPMILKILNIINYWNIQLMKQIEKYIMIPDHLYFILTTIYNSHKILLN